MEIMCENKKVQFTKKLVAANTWAINFINPKELHGKDVTIQV
jgi:hypothetical protein